MAKRTVISKATLAVTATGQTLVSAHNALKEMDRVQNNSAILMTFVTDPTQTTGGWQVQPGTSETIFTNQDLYAYSASGTPVVDVLTQFLM